MLHGPVGRQTLFMLATRQTVAKTQGNYPAASRIIDVVRIGMEQGSRAGHDAEAHAFGELAMTPESAALRGIFVATTAMKKE